MIKLFKNPAQIVTVNTHGKNFKSGKEMDDLDVLIDHSLLVKNGRISKLIPNSKIKNTKYDEEIDCSGKVILPGLVECHTHTAFAGSRADEFRMKLSGVDYEEIAKKGGGINSTVQAVRKSSFDELVTIVKPRIDNFISQGITTLEIKSGYGLSYSDEIKLLQVIKHLNSISPIDIVPTFLGAHTYPPEYKNDHSKYIDIIANELLPYISKNNLAVFCDGFCEATAFSADEIDLIFSKAKSLGMDLKLHTEQFNNIGGIKTALKHQAVSVDHLEVVDESDIKSLCENQIVSVLLPGVSFFLDYGYAPARKLIDEGATVALSTDFNPGSSHISNIFFILSLAALKMKMTIEETISAFTINAAKGLKLEKNIGSIELGKLADFAIFNTTEFSDIVYSVANNLVAATVKAGEIIYNKN